MITPGPSHRFPLLLLCLSLLVTSGAGAADVPPEALGGCVSSPTTLCLDSDRFAVEVDWVDGVDSGQGEVLLAYSNDTGFFSLADAEVAEILVRVIDACSFNGNYWVNLANVSNLGQTITVTDTALGGQAQYTVMEGSYGQPVIDTAALPCTPRTPSGVESAPAPGLARGGTSLQLAGRFRVEVEWQNGGGSSGQGQPLPLTDESGAFWIFAPTNPEILAKMVPDTGSGFYTFVYSALANVQLDFTVTDLCSGAVETYSQTLGASTTAADPVAFPITCAAAIFAGTFESGNFDGWSQVVGGG